MSDAVSRSDLFTGTMPVAEKQRFDMVALEAYLSVHVEGFGGALTIEQFKGGQSNPTFKLVTPKKAYVMRCKPGPVTKLLPSAHAIEREFRVMRALSSSAVPVAAMHTLCEDESVIGRAFYVMDFVDGRVLWEPQLPGMNNDQRAAIFDEMNRVIAALHQVDFAAAGLADYGKHEGYLARQIARWTKQYRASETESIASMDALIEWLPAHIPPGDETSIVHGDYRLDNVIFHPTESRILAVLDWELSTLGHPLADFAYHCMTWYLPPGAGRGLAGFDLTATGIPGVKDYIATYCERTDRSNGIEHFEFYMAFNMFRMAGILQGIMKRVVDGTAASAQAIQMAKAARPIADEGWRVARSIQQ
jgi:aminoglycoside phosphotransferase (APT) family kinase protein